MEKIFALKTGKSILAMVALVLSGLVLLSPGSLFALDNADSGKLERYFKGRYGVYLPRGFTVKAVGGEDSQIKKFREGRYEIGFPDGRNQTLPFLVSSDGKFLIMGDLEDLDEDPAAETARKISLENVPSKGDPKARVTVVEYSDFQCGYCARAADEVADFLKDYKGKVRFFYKQFPLSFHKWAEQASIASLCVYDQANEKFWEFHDAIFEKQSEIKVADAKETLAGMARKLGVDMKKYNECVESEEARRRVASDMREGRSIGISGTPTFVVDGFVISGGANMKALRDAVDYRLSLNSAGSGK